MNENKQPKTFAPQTEPFTADGLLVIDKPADWTSHDVVARVRRILRTRRVGHTGTLDPFATGVLVICLNRATRLVQFLTGDDKEYLATVRLGFATDTGDLTGTPLASTATRRAESVTVKDFAAALTYFRGRILQTPPMYSAKKVGGVKLYELARRGEEIARQAVEVEIKELELCPVEENEEREISHAQSAGDVRDFDIRVVCSSGTYIRTLAADIGEHLGAGAHLSRLRRTRAGKCKLSHALTLEQLAEAAATGVVAQSLIPSAAALEMTPVLVGDEERSLLASGRRLRRAGDWPSGWLGKLCDASGELLAVAEFDAGTQSWQPRVVLMES